MFTTPRVSGTTTTKVVWSIISLGIIAFGAWKSGSIPLDSFTPEDFSNFPPGSFKP